MYRITFHVTVLGGTEYTDGAMVGHITLRAVYLHPQKKNSTVWANTARTKYKISKRSSSVSFPFDYLGDLV